MKYEFDYSEATIAEYACGFAPTMPDNCKQSANRFFGNNLQALYEQAIERAYYYGFRDGQEHIVNKAKQIVKTEEVKT